MLVDDFQQDDSEGNGFSKKTCSETISCYTKFINSNHGAHSLRSRVKGEGERAQEKNGDLGARPPFFSRARSPSPLVPATQATVCKAIGVKVGLK